MPRKVNICISFHPIQIPSVRVQGEGWKEGRSRVRYCSVGKSLIIPHLSKCREAGRRLAASPARNAATRQ